MNILSMLKKEVSQQELLNYYNANITFQKLPEYVNGFVFNYKGIYNIYINEDISYYKKKKTLLHELAHIEKNHLCQCDKDLVAFNINKYEDEADKYVKSLLSYLEDN